VPNWLEMSEIKIKKKNDLFKKYFNECEMLLEIANGDSDFQKEFQKCMPETCQFLNSLIKH